MKFVIAPDKFKGSLTGLQFCDAVKTGLSSEFPNADISSMPLADGGDGTIEVVKYYLNPEEVSLEVRDPLFRPVQATYLYAHNKHIAYIEMAEASGLKLLKEGEINCMHTSTLGTGELIVDAINRGAKEIILGVGGSATNDAGMGMGTALGIRFLDRKKRELRPIGAELKNLAHVDMTKMLPGLKNTTFKTACDVRNPLYGQDGAAYVYAGQKGASAMEIVLLDSGLRNFSSVIKKQFKINLQKIEGAGAAGGLGAASVAFLHSSLVPGIDLMKEIANFDEKIEGADWIITGEGKLDKQTMFGKTIGGVLKSAKDKGIPVAAFCGKVEIAEEKLKELGINYAVSVSDNMPSLKVALEKAHENVLKAAGDFAVQLG